MPPKLDPKLTRKAMDEYINNDISIVACAEKHGIGATTLTKYLRREGYSTDKYKKKFYKYNESYFETINTEEKAYWLGFIAADGSIVDRNDNVLEISLSKKDRPHLEKFVEAIGAPLEIVRDRQERVKDKLYLSSRVSICSKQVCQDLEKYGIIANKGFVLDFPETSNEELLRHYLRGYFDGDGSISTNGTHRSGKKKWALNLIATESFLLKFMSHMKTFGITEVTLQHRGPISIWNKVGANQIRIVLNYLYKDCSVALDRKHQLAKQLCRP